MQGISWNFLINVSKENEISGFVAFDDEINDVIKFQKENSVIQQDLNSTTEEAVIHLIRYANQAIKQNSKKFVISNDADVAVLVLYYMEKLIKKGLQILLIRYDTIDHTTYLSIHIMYEVMGANFCADF